MENIPWKLVIAVVVLIGLGLVPYIIGPFLIHGKIKQKVKPKLGKFAAADPNLPKKVASFFRKVRQALEPLGFEVVEGVTLPDQTPGVKAILLLLANRQEKTAVLASTIFAGESDETKLKQSYLEFVSGFKDRTAIVTNNTKTLSTFYPKDGVTTFRLPMVTKPEELYQTHQALTKRHGSNARKMLRLDDEFKGDAAAWLARSMVEELETQVENGYFYLSDDEKFFCPTWRGAFMMTWGELWPFKNLRAAKRDKLARQILDELEA